MTTFKVPEIELLFKKLGESIGEFYQLNRIQNQRKAIKEKAMHL